MGGKMTSLELVNEARQSGLYPIADLKLFETLENIKICNNVKDNLLYVTDELYEYLDKINEFANTLTGDVNNDLAYVLGGVHQADGSYKFTENSKIAVDGAAAIQADSDLNVDASGKALVLKANNYGVKNATLIV